MAELSHIALAVETLATDVSLLIVTCREGQNGALGSRQDGRRGTSNCSSVWTALLVGPDWYRGSPESRTVGITGAFKQESMLPSLTPFRFSRPRSFLFSSATFRAACCISAEASTPCNSHWRNFCSSSWRYSFRRARDLLWLSRIRAKLAFSYVRWKSNTHECKLRQYQGTDELLHEDRYPG